MKIKMKISMKMKMKRRPSFARMQDFFSSVVCHIFCHIFSIQIKKKFFKKVMYLLVVGSKIGVYDNLGKFRETSEHEKILITTLIL